MLAIVALGKLALDEAEAKKRRTKRSTLRVQEGEEGEIMAPTAQTGHAEHAPNLNLIPDHSSDPSMVHKHTEFGGDGVTPLTAASQFSLWVNEMSGYSTCGLDTTNAGWACTGTYACKEWVEAEKASGGIISDSPVKNKDQVNSNDVGGGVFGGPAREQAPTGASFRWINEMSGYSDCGVAVPSWDEEEGFASLKKSLYEAEPPFGGSPFKANGILTAGQKGGLDTPTTIDSDALDSDSGQAVSNAA